ncbi:unnamed protein product [Phaedon cochleariae]|uniref:Calponin-homology (CH) domain-containing protein n=1 Tax=Phaedon cochleariae TaxID=80249 RepID=A0A9P0DBE5_PHACE|nr:unnamed protein product [Phaedon cochleariae]
MFFQISPVRIEKKKKIDTPEKVLEEVEVLSLAPFSSIPKLSFENIKVGSVATRQLIIKNPTNQEVNLFLSRILPDDLNVSYSWKNKVIESGGETIFELTWCPLDEGSSRHIISFTDTKKLKRDIPVTFKSRRALHDKPKSTRPRQKSPPKKSTIKYYPARPTRISPKKFGTSPKKNLTLKKYSPSPVKNDFPIHKRKSSRSTLQAKPTYGDKENIPSSFLDTSRASDIFISPKNVSFTLGDLQTEVRRGTYVLKDNKISPVSEFDDSLERISPATSPTQQREPLGNYIGDNLSPYNGYRKDDYNTGDFAYKLNRNSFFLTPSTTPVRKTATVPPQIHIETLNIKSVLEDTCRNRTYEWPSLTLNVSSETYIKANTSGDTYVKSNLSGATYTRDNSIGDLTSLNVSPFSIKVSPEIRGRVSPKHLRQQRCPSPLNFSYSDTDYMKRAPQVNHFDRIEGQELSRIEEESYIHSSRDSTKIHHNTMKRRKLDADLTVTAPKQPSACSAKDWSRKGGAALRIVKKTSGLNLTNLKNRPTDHDEETIMKISKKDTNTVIIQNPFLLAATNLVDPFMTPNLYVNDQWIDKQEVDLKKWLNALLTPPQELSAEERVIDVAKVWQECKKREVDVVPNKEQISNDYHINTKLNNLRKSAQNLFRSSEVGLVLSKVIQAVDSGKLSVRTDKDIHLNLILKSEIIGLLLNYNTLWLRIALETIYNEIIPLSSNSDIVGLSTFIVNRVIKDPYLVRKFKSVHSPKYAGEFKKFFLKKFLILVYFLDQAKNQKLIPHDPCLFRKNGAIKESKELLLILARETLFAVGDITKSLKFLGYTVSHVQTYIHEFDYTVTNLGVDLRDGVRLSKIMEIILMQSNIQNNLRVPAISRLQKIHNMKIVFDSLEGAGYKILYDISPKDIVDGHREKTLSFLWQIIYKFEAPLMVKSVTTIQKWFRSLPVVLKRRRLRRILMRRENAAKKIQGWYKRQRLSKNIERFAAGYKQYLEHMRRERAAVRIQSYYKMYVCQKSYRNKLQTIVDVQRICRGYLVRNINTVQIRSAVVIQSYAKMYIARKHYLKLKQSTLVIQARYRAQKEMKLKQSAYNKLKSTVIFIQQKFRANQLAADQRQRYLQLRSAVISVQRRIRANKSCRTESQKYNEIKSAAVTIQTWYRSIKTMRSHREQYLQLKRNVLIVEQRFSAMKAMRTERQNYLLVRTACINIQLQYRALRSMRMERKRFSELKSAAVCLQQRYRAKKAMERELLWYRNLHDAALFVQRRYRANKCMRINRTKFLRVRNATTKIQLWFRATLEMRKYRTNYLSLKYAVRILEDRYEALTLMKKAGAEFQKMRSSTILLQQKYRALLTMRFERNKFCQLKSATISIQRRFRSNKMANMQRLEYLNLKQATVDIQRRFRAKRDMRICLQEFVLLKKTTIMLQRRVRANKIMTVTRDAYKSLLIQTIFIQRKFRANRLARIHRTNYLKLKQASVVLQRRFRAQRDMRICLDEFVLLKKATVMIQRKFRANNMMKAARNVYESILKQTIFIQRKFRANRLARIQRTNYLKLKQASVVLQRRFRAQRDMRICLDEFVLLKKATIMVQTRFRAKLMMIAARDAYKSLLKQTIFIQRKFRANRLARIHRTNYLKLKQASVVLQRRFRAQKDMRICLDQFVLLKKATIMVQTRFRAKLVMIAARDAYTSLLKHTIFIQRKFRANRLSQIHRTNYLRLKQATVIIQARFRAQRAMRVCAQEFVLLKKTTVMLQRRVRANKMMRVAQDSYKSLLKAAILIQTRWRAKQASEEARNSFLALRQATVLVQQQWRAKKIGMREKLQFEAMKKASIIIQRRWRALKSGRHVRNDYQKLKIATLTVQQMWRAKISMRIHSRYYKILKNAVIILQRRYRAQVLMKKQLSAYKKEQNATICIQRFYRGYLEMKAAKAEYELKKKAIIRIQSHIKGYSVRQKYAHYFTPEAKEQRRIEKQHNEAALRIQAYWRGYKSRSLEPNDCAKIRKRMLKANAEAMPEKTLECKSRVALQTFANQSSTLFHIIKALEDIDYVTRRCESKCIEMAQLLPDQLYIMLGATSRSLPEMNACIYSVNILINICKCPSTKKYSFVPQYIDNLLAVMLHWCDKESQLFPTLCTLLWLFAHTPQWKRNILKLPNIVQRLMRIQGMVARKETMVKRSTSKVLSHFATLKNLPMPSLLPDWGLDYANNPNVFTNSVHAFNSLLSILEI